MRAGSRRSALQEREGDVHAERAQEGREGEKGREQGIDMCRDVDASSCSARAHTSLHTERWGRLCSMCISRSWPTWHIYQCLDYLMVLAAAVPSS
jgi:hypothetical protein